MKYKGLSASRRKSLAHLLASGKGAITIDDASQKLGWEREKARAFLSSLQRSGWLKLIEPGLYAPVPLESDQSDLTAENELVLASYLFGDCYISGWSAASFWGLTDQLFLKTWVFTTQRVPKKEVVKGGHTYRLKRVTPNYLFGLHTEWIAQDKIRLSDPHKTVTDLINFTEEYGAQGMIDTFEAYLQSEHKNLPLLLNYALKAGNRTIFKRLGFMLEMVSPHEREAIATCLQHISQGPSQLAPNISCTTYLSKWKLKVPMHMARAARDS